MPPGGLLQDAPILRQTAASLRTVYAPKAEGFVRIWDNVAYAPPPSTHLFSSIAAFMGSAGQGPYAAANATLDGFAAALQGQGIFGTLQAFTTRLEPC